MTLQFVLPQYDVTWALPPDRDISKVLRKPQCELYRDDIDCQFLSHSSYGGKVNLIGKNNFFAKFHGLQKETVFCDFRYPFKSKSNTDKFKEMLEFEPNLTEQVRQNISEQFGDSYAVIHARVGDDTMKGISVDISRIVLEIDKYVSESAYPVVLVSDDMRLKEMMRSKMLVSDAVPFHSGRVSGDARSFMLDVCIIQNAVQVFALSNNGSTTFSRIPALFAGVPYRCRSLRR